MLFDEFKNEWIGGEHGAAAWGYTRGDLVCVIALFRVNTYAKTIGGNARGG